MSKDALRDAGTEIAAGRLSTELHLFEHPRVQIFPNSLPEDCLQVAFAIKEKNAGKLSSHRWFFDALCKKLQPEVIYVRRFRVLCWQKHSDHAAARTAD